MQKLLSIFHYSRKFICLIFGAIIITTAFFNSSIFAATTSAEPNLAIDVAPADPTSAVSHLAAKPIVVTNRENRSVAVSLLLVTGYDKSLVKYCPAGDTSCTYVSTCRNFPNSTTLASGESCYIYLQAKNSNQITPETLDTKHPMLVTLSAIKGSANCLVTKFFNIAYGNALYIGGKFAAAGDSTNKTNNIAKWDGANWSALGTGLNNDVSALTMYRGDLYAGGNFNSGGLVSWNGANWKSVIKNGYVLALAVSGNNLYAGGIFNTIYVGDKSLVVNNIVSWNGSDWSSLATGTNNIVRALAVSGNNLYAAGQFDNAGGVAVNNIAMWDGSKWSNLGHGTDGNISALAVNGDDLYVGGTFNYAGGAIARGIAKWDSHNGWSTIPGVNSSNIYALAVNGKDIYAGGYFSASGWTRQECIGIWDSVTANWRHMGIGTDNMVRAMTVNGNDLYVGGYFPSINSGAIPAHKIAKWDMVNSSWSTLGNGVIGDANAAVDSAVVAPSLQIVKK